MVTNERDESMINPTLIRSMMSKSKTQLPGQSHSVLIQGSVVVIRQFLIFINQTFLMVSVALVTMVD